MLYFIAPKWKFGPLLQAQEGFLLDGKLEEYREAFKAVDTGGNGMFLYINLHVYFVRICFPELYLKCKVLGMTLHFAWLTHYFQNTVHMANF